MKVEQVMTRGVRVCVGDDSLNRVAQMMWEGDCGCLPVITVNGEGKVVGMITDRDVAMAAYTQGKPLAAIGVSSAMSREVVFCQAGDDIEQAEAAMRAAQVRRLPVVDAAGKLVGIVSLNDIARAAEREAAAGRRRQITATGVVATLSAVCQPRREPAGSMEDVAKIGPAPARPRQPGRKRAPKRRPDELDA